MRPAVETCLNERPLFVILAPAGIQGLVCRSLYAQMHIISTPDFIVLNPGSPAPAEDDGVEQLLCHREDLPRIHNALRVKDFFDFPHLVDLRLTAGVV